jgi:progressive ankylosis protein
MLELEKLSNQRTMTAREIFIFWLPLAATWVMMAAEQPFVNAMVARLAEPELNLAALGVAFSVVLICEAPLFMMMAAATSLVKDSVSYRRLRNFNWILGGTLTLFPVLIFSEAGFAYISNELLHLPPEISPLARGAGQFLTIIPAAVSFRRFNQGILISHHLTKKVGQGTVIRFLSMALAALGLYFFSSLNGARLGALAVAVGLTVEAAVSRWMVNKLISRLKPPRPQDELSYKQIAAFYTPLALNGVIVVATNPILTFFLSKSPAPVRSLAVYPVISGFLFLFTALPLAMQEVIIARIGAAHEGFEPLKQFALRLGAIMLAALMLLFFTPLSYVCFMDLGGLSPDLADFAVTPGRLAALLPILSFVNIWQRAFLLHKKVTAPITLMSTIELAALTGLMLAGNRGYFALSGAAAAFFALLVSRALGAVGLSIPYARVRRTTHPNFV